MSRVTKPFPDPLVPLGSRPAYRVLPMTRPLCGLQRSKRNRMSGLSHTAAVLGTGAGADLRLVPRLCVPAP